MRPQNPDSNTTLRSTAAVRVRPILRGIGIGVWLVVAGWAAAIGCIGLWLIRTGDGELREQLKHWQFWALELQFWLLVGLSWINLPALVRALDLKKKDLVFPVAASALAFALTTFVAPRTNRIYYDEQIYESIGQNLADLRLAQMCNDGNVEYGVLQCSSGEYNKEPYGYSYLLSVAYRLFGVHEQAAFVMNTLFAAALVWVVFFASTALTGSVRAGGYAAVAIALIPDQLRWAHTAASEPSAAFACAYAVMTALAFVRLRSTGSLWWMAVATVFAAHFRPECILVAPVVAAICLLYAPEEFLRRRLWWVALGGLLLATAHIGHLAAVRHEGWGTSGTRLSLAFLAPNLRMNGWFYFGDARFPVAFSALALIALIPWRRARGILVCSIYFLLFWGIFLFFYAGSYNYGADDRFSLMTYPPLAMLAGIGLWKLSDAIDANSRGPRSSRIVAGVLAAQFLWYMPVIRTVGEEAWAARADVAFARSATAGLPGNSIVLTHNPSMFHLWGQSAAQASLASNSQSYAKNILAPRYAGGVFFHWNFWCNVADPVQQSFCTEVLNRFPHTLIRESRERDYRFAIYRLDVTSDRNIPPPQ